MKMVFQSWRRQQLSIPMFVIALKIVHLKINMEILIHLTGPTFVLVQEAALGLDNYVRYYSQIWKKYWIVLISFVRLMPSP